MGPFFCSWFPQLKTETRNRCFVLLPPSDTLTSDHDPTTFCRYSIVFQTLPRSSDVCILLRLSRSSEPEARSSAVRFTAPGIRGRAGELSCRGCWKSFPRSRRRCFSDDYAYHQLAHLTENIGPRPRPDRRRPEPAVEYVARELRQLGLDVHLEEVKVPHWVRGAETAELVEYAGQATGTTQKVVLTALGGSGSTPAEGLTADVVVVNNFDELKALGHDKVAGKIVLFNELFDKQKAAAGMAFMAYGEAVRYRGAGPKAGGRVGRGGGISSLGRRR